MARAAGNDSHYTWHLNGRPGLADLRLPSVTTIIHAVTGSSFAPASKWGFKLGLRAAFPTMSDDEFEKVLTKAYDSEHSPENVRDSAGFRGSFTHDYFELLGTRPDASVKDGYNAVLLKWMTEDEDKPDNEVRPLPVLTEIEGYLTSVRKWWDAEMPGWEVVQSEAIVFSLKHQFAGTADLIRKRVGAVTEGASAARAAVIAAPPAPTTYEVLDLKTHSGSARDDDRVQIAAYELAAREMGLIPASDQVQHRVVLARADGKKAGQSTKYTDPQRFLEMKAVYDGMRGGK